MTEVDEVVGVERGGEGGRPTEGFNCAEGGKWAFSRGFRNIWRYDHILSQEENAEEQLMVNFG
jgi:hypothetical protein